MTQPFYSYLLTQEKQKHMFIKTLEYKPHSRFVCNSQNEGKSRIHQQMNEQIVAFLYNGIVLRNENE